ncbi:MAG: DegV family EDD domain-containing protein [Candidatus Heimdallarchaeota archaeon]|nr:DegV family EDD domain-containing protein [Candidatus Heimdallarchaeota archaeon]
MPEQMKKFTVLCPFCKETISFEIHEEDLESRYSGGLAGILIPIHGNPPHKLEVYIDRDGLIRGAYPIIEEGKLKSNLQNSYFIDATSEITPQEGKAIGVTVLPFTIVIKGQPEKCYNEEIFFTEIFENLKADKKVQSKPVSIEAFQDAFTSAPKDKPIIVLLVSKRYSEGYSNAMKAREFIAKEQPERAKSIHIFNSKTVGPLLKLMIINAIAMDEEGKSLEAILDYLQWVSEKHVSYVYVDSLDALRKSERVGKVTTFFGNLLGLKPVIIENRNSNGDLKAFTTVRSKEAAMQEIVKAIKKEYEDQELIGVIFYGIIIDDAHRLKELLDTEIGLEQDNLTMDFIGTGVAIHLSYDVLGISIYPKK